MQIAVALLPVVLLLIVLTLLDSFKLVRPRALLTAVAAGALAALVCNAIHAALVDRLELPPLALTRYIAPVTEETAKAIYVVMLVRSRRAGFLVDAAIQGFAIGTGFAIIENAAYLREIPDAPFALWLVRGLGTAVLHGATVTTFAILSKVLSDRWPTRPVLAFVPGWLTAVVVHSAFNHLLVPPVVMTLLLLIVMPLLVLFVFARSEQMTRDWVGAGLDLDLELLELILSEHFQGTRFASYLRTLQSRFPGPIVADMFCLLRLELEMSIQAKAMLLARQAGVDVAIDDDLRACLDEIAHLNRSIGATGRLALKPLHVTTGRDEWHRYLLRSRSAAKALR